MAIPPLIGNPYNGYINPYYWVDDHPLLYGNNGSLDPSTNGVTTPPIGVKKPSETHLFSDIFFRGSITPCITGTAKTAHVVGGRGGPRGTRIPFLWFPKVPLQNPTWRIIPGLVYRG